MNELASEPVLSLLARYGLDVLVAVTPATRAALPEVLRALHDRGVFAAVWPMIDDDDGRWASARTLGSFVAFVDSLTAELARSAVPLAEIAIDLEPPFFVAKAASHGAWLGPLRTAIELREDYAAASVTLRGFVARLGADLRVSCAAVPLVLLDGDHETDADRADPGEASAIRSAGRAAPEADPGAREGGAVASLARPFFQGILGTPVDGVAFGSVSIMAYTSILEGWSRGLLDRRASLGVLGECARLARARYGDRASISVGTVGTGAFTDEPVYRSVAELAEDVAVARAFGVDDLSLFDLGGLLRRGPAEAWLEAFVTDRDAPSDLPRRVRLGSAALRALARLPRR